MKVTNKYYKSKSRSREPTPKRSTKSRSKSTERQMTEEDVARTYTGTFLLPAKKKSLKSSVFRSGPSHGRGVYQHLRNEKRQFVQLERHFNEQLHRQQLSKSLSFEQRRQFTRLSAQQVTAFYSVYIGPYQNYLLSCLDELSRTL